jgi:osmotically-inducible protein OsmY
MRVHTVVVALTLALGLAACEGGERGPDVGGQANEALHEQNLRHVAVVWDGGSDVLHLTGEVRSAEERERAQEVVRQAVGEHVQIANELVVHGYAATAGDIDDDRDEEIRQHLEEAVENDPVLKDRPVEFRVNNRVVTITGNVRTVQERNQAHQLARTAKGVGEVVNALEVKPDE